MGYLLPTGRPDSRRSPSRWTRPLQILTAVCSLVFTAGTVTQNFAIIDIDMLEHAMRLAGKSAATAADTAPAFRNGLRAVGALYIVGNALGVLALLGWTWVFWVAILVNLTQAAGVVVIPSAVWEASVHEYGPAGVLPSIITDAGALVLVLVLIAAFIRFRTPWAVRSS